MRIQELCVSVIFLMLISLLIPAIEADAFKETFDVVFESDPRFAEVNEPVNIDNATSADTVIGQWREDLGNEMPNGTYYGPLLRPSLFEFQVTGTWKENETLEPHVTGGHGQYTFVLLSCHLNFTAQTLMSGCSEFWMRLPFTTSSVEVGLGWTVALFEGLTNASEVYLYDEFDTKSTTIGRTQGTYYQSKAPRISYDGDAPDTLVKYYHPVMPIDGSGYFTGWGNPINASDDLEHVVIVGDRIYQHVHAVLLPGTDYVIGLGLRLPADLSLQCYFASSDQPYGLATHVEYAEVFIHGTAPYKWEKLCNQTSDLYLDMDLSFVFTEGLGMGGLFGVELNVPAHTYLNIFPFFNTTRSGDQYMSGCLPFISDEVADVHPSIFNIEGHDWTFNDGRSYFDPVDPLAPSGPSGWTWYDFLHYNYTDFILFSSNSTVDFATMTVAEQSGVHLAFYFQNETNLTLLCYNAHTERIPWNMGIDNSSVSPMITPTVEHLGVNWSYNDSAPLDDWVYALHYDVWCSLRGTDGQWTMRNGSAETGYTYTYHFPQIVTLSTSQWRLRNDTTEADTEVITYWDLATQSWNEGHYLRAAYYAFKGTMQSLWDAGSTLAGYVTDFLGNAWEKMVELGSWLKTSIAEFAGKIWSLVQSAVDTIVDFWNIVSNLVAPTIMMAGTGLAVLTVRRISGTGVAE